MPVAQSESHSATNEGRWPSAVGVSHRPQSPTALSTAPGPLEMLIGCRKTSYTNGMYF